MRVVHFILFFLIIGFAHAADEKTPEQAPKKSEETYINILSNLDNIEITLNGKSIGVAPIRNFSLKPNVEHTLKAINKDPYHKKELTKKIQIPTNNIETFVFEFEPLKSEVFLIGEAGELYINGKFVQQLYKNNRIVEVDAAKEVSFAIYNKDKQTTFKKDIKGDQFLQVKYTLNNIPKAIRLYTVFTGEGIWEDTVEAKTQNIKWAEAKKYCKNLEVAYLKNWRLPTVEELDELYEKHQEKIYNGFGEPFYWSSENFLDDSQIWSYAKVKSFTDGEVKKSIQEFEQGKVRCIHELSYDDKIEEKEIKTKEDLEEVLKPGEYDKDLTKDLQRFMLK